MELSIVWNKLVTYLQTEGTKLNLNNYGKYLRKQLNLLIKYYSPNEIDLIKTTDIITFF